MGLLAVFVPWQAISVPAAPNCDAGDPSIDAEEASFVEAMNRHRTDRGLQPLVVSPALNRVGAWMARDMAQRGAVAHSDSLGRDPFRRMADCGFPFAPAAENVGAGTLRDSGRAAFDLFRGSPQHDSIMLDSDFVVVGVAREFLANSTHSWYWAVEFGPSVAAATPTAAPTQPAVAPVVRPAAVVPEGTSAPVPVAPPVEAAQPPQSPAPALAGSERDSDPGPTPSPLPAARPLARPLADISKIIAAVRRLFTR